MKESNFKFLIIGAGRGGTSLLTGLLDYHSRLEVLTEYASISYLMGRDYQCADNKIIPQRIIAFIDQCQLKASETPDKIWGNKITTEQLYALEEHNRKNPEAHYQLFDVFFKLHFKKYKLIFILRDGRSCVLSKVQRTGQSMQTACEKWKYSILVHQYLQSCAHSISIKYEDLLLKPEETLQGVCQFMQIDYEAHMLKGVANQKLMLEYQNTQLLTEKARVKEIPDKYYQLIKDELAYCQYI